MKVIRKLKTPLIRDNGIECTCEIISNDELKTPLAELPEFDGRILEPLIITESQKVLFSSMARTFFGVSYLPRSVLQYACESCGATHFAYIEHNKDVLPTGEIKKPHFHYLVNFDDKVSMSRLIFWFRCVEIRVVSTENVAREWDYLTHNSEKCRKEHKVPYDKAEIVSNDFTYWQGRYTPITEFNVALQMFDDYRAGLKVREMLKRYGFKFLIYKKALVDCVADILDEERELKCNEFKKPVLIDYGGEHIISNIPELNGIKRSKTK